MKYVLNLTGVMVLMVLVASCDLLKKAPPESNAVDTDSAAAPEAAVVGEGLNEAEAKALLREEKVMAGTSIGKDDVQNELLRIEEEIRADIEGREPDFANAGVKPELKPLVAKETFSASTASSDLDYERDMVIMKMMREYISEKKAEQAKAETDSDKK